MLYYIILSARPFGAHGCGGDEPDFQFLLLFLLILLVLLILLLLLLSACLPILFAACLLVCPSCLVTGTAQTAPIHHPKPHDLNFGAT